VQYTGILKYIPVHCVFRQAPTPEIGVWERINIGVYMLWVVVLVMMLLRRENKSASLSENTSALALPISKKKSYGNY
jgi:hypothetical protein